MSYMNRLDVEIDEMMMKICEMCEPCNECSKCEITVKMDGKAIVVNALTKQIISVTEIADDGNMSKKK